MSKPMSRALAATATLVTLSVTPQLQAQTISTDPHEARIVPPQPDPVPPPPRPVPPPYPRPPVRHTPLTLKKHNVEVKIVDGVAVTGIDQVFFNPYPHPIEGTYIFPLPDDVAVSRFSMFINGQEIEGKVLGVDEARRQYESIVARMRDPALLEYLGTRMFQARIFPIEPKGEARVKLTYNQVLASDAGIVHYTYPLALGRHGGSPIESLSFVVNIESTVGIKSVFSPSHELAIHRDSDHKASASFEASNVQPTKDFELFYALSDKEFGLSVLTYREAGEEGFFLVRIAPPARTAEEDVMPKDIAFVFDTSGSMNGEKIEQARSALKFCLNNLNKQDRFHIVPFSHEALRFRDALAEATPENVKAAVEYVETLKATGGTNINDALLAALEAAPNADAARPYLIVFLTDGQPTVGELSPDTILSNIKGKNPGQVRLFVFGVGFDVNTKLLDLLAEQNRGTRDYVLPNEDLELKLSSFYRKVADPVLADLKLAFGGPNVNDIYPPKLGDLFSGTELVVTGRYQGDGQHAVDLTGTRRGKQERFVYESTFPAVSTKHPFLPRLWATRKVGFLLDEIRLHGENKELKDTIVELATRYGIVTPYTAYLVTEPDSIAMRRGGWVPEAFAQSDGTLSREFRPDDVHMIRNRVAPGARQIMAADGGGAVAASKSARELQRADAALPPGIITGRPETTPGSGTTEDATSRIERVGTRTFYLVNERWVDGGFEEGKETTKVELFSEAYFDLLRTHPNLAKCFALGERVVVVVDGQAYETVPPADAP